MILTVSEDYINYNRLEKQNANNIDYNDNFFIIFNFFEIMTTPKRRGHDFAKKRGVKRTQVALIITVIILVMLTSYQSVKLKDLEKRW